MQIYARPKPHFDHSETTIRPAEICFLGLGRSIPIYFGAHTAALFLSFEESKLQYGFLLSLFFAKQKSTKNHLNAFSFKNK